MPYDPAIHDRRSIRLKGHDYAGGSEYFITICAHRDFIDAAGGRPFDATRGIIEEEWRRCGEIRKGVYPGECVVMPDHFHGLIRIEPGASALGNVIGAFKAAVSRRVRATGATCVSPVRCAPSSMRIWHRNYYECIVRNAEHRERIAHYIRMNPVRLVFELSLNAGKRVGARSISPGNGARSISPGNAGNGARSISPGNAGNGATCVSPVRARAMGNPAIWAMPKIGVLCSRGAIGRHACRPHRRGHAYISGWHSPGEKEILIELLREKKYIIAVPPVAVEEFHVPADWLEAFNEGHILLVAPFHETGFSRSGAMERNCFVAEQVDRLWMPFVRPGGGLEAIKKEFLRKVF